MERKLFPKRPEIHYRHEHHGEYVLMYGTIEDGFSCVGPFESDDAAREWHDRSTSSSACELMLLYRPEVHTVMVPYNPDLER